jgi:hypothetical protein
MFPMCWGLVKQPLYLKKDKMKISEIKLNKKNPRLIKDYKFEKLKKSITEFPKMLELRPIIIDNDNIILGGNMRYQALKDLGYKELPDNWVKKSSELSEEEKQRFVIADNVGFGDWDFELLVNEYDSELIKDYDLFFDNTDELIAKETEYQPLYEIVPNYDEEYNIYVILATNKIEKTFIETYFDLNKMQSYKNSSSGETFVIPINKIYDKNNPISK